MSRVIDYSFCEVARRREGRRSLGVRVEQSPLGVRVDALLERLSPTVVTPTVGTHPTAVPDAMYTTPVKIHHDMGVRAERAQSEPPARVLRLLSNPHPSPNPRPRPKPNTNPNPNPKPNPIPNPTLTSNPNPNPSVSLSIYLSNPNQVLRLLSQYADLDLEDRRLFDLYAREPHTR